eukprot:m.461297 g.461297  ORF g.461297 m.461297 type:complete len:271 (-) comp22265_c0_seq1:1487-2299(-)
MRCVSFSTRCSLSELHLPGKTLNIFKVKVDLNLTVSECKRQLASFQESRKRTMATSGAEDIMAEPTAAEIARRVEAEVDGVVLPTSEAAQAEAEATMNKGWLAGLEVERLGQVNPLDAVVTHPTTDAKIYIGNHVAARSLPILQAHNITRVVCCAPELENFHEEVPGFKYLDANPFDCGGAVLNFFGPVFDFVEEGLTAGESALVHCWAGAHRAGTVGTACIMKFTGSTFEAALDHAQARRSVVDPEVFIEFPRLLKKLEKALKETPETT